MVQWTRSGKCIKVWSKRRSLEQAVVSFEQLDAQARQQPMTIQFSRRLPRESTALTCSIPVQDATEAVESCALFEGPIATIMKMQITRIPVLVRWMYADTFLAKRIHAFRHISRKNPFHWSQARDIQNTLVSLGKLITEDRSVRLEIWTSEACGKTIRYATTAPSVAAAVDTLNSFQTRPSRISAVEALSSSTSQSSIGSSVSDPTVEVWIASRRSACLPQPKLEPGMVVEIFGLQSNRLYNGQTAVLESMEDTNGKCKIRLADDSIKTIAADNLVKSSLCMM